MNTLNNKNGWVERLWKVLSIFIVVLTLPIMFFSGIEAQWTGGTDRYSRVFFYMAIFTFFAYLFYILIAKIFLYIFKNQSFMESKPSKKGYLMLSLPIMLTLVASGIFAFVVEPIQKTRDDKNRLSDYNNALEIVQTNSEAVTKCAEPVREKKFQENLKECNLLKNKVKHDYDFCVSLDMVNSPASCIYENNYKKIDCSEETLRNQAKNSTKLSDLPEDCSILADKVIKAKILINEYENKTN